MADQKLEQTTTQRTIITQRQLRFVSALEKTAQEFDREVEKELDENSALEAEADPGHDELKLQAATRERYYNNPRYSADDEKPEFAPRDDSATLYDYLRSQLAEQRAVSEQTLKAAEYVIDSLEPDGYLRRSVAELGEDMVFHHSLYLEEATIREAVEIIRKMDPAGIGAADLRDCLMLQLERMPKSDIRDNALAIVEKKFDALSSRHYHKIISGLKLKEEPLKEALDLIMSLNPRPGLAIGDSTETTNIIIPDFIIAEDSDTGELTIHLNNRIPELRIAESFESAVRLLETSKKEKAAKNGKNQYILSRYNDAKEFLQVFRQRQETLFTVMSAIVKLQREYFETADIYNLKPMMLKDLEKETGLDMSTISRATKNKFVDLPWGTFPLRFFFSDSKGARKGTGGEEKGAVTNRKLEEEIRRIVEEEDKRHPLSDDKIYREMEKRGYTISRRTVTKYRERCNIPVARLRRQ